jgi:mannose-1-phosphate guanylyltransferase
MGSLSADRPKHLLEVAGEPLVVHQLRWLAAHGVVDVVLATSHLADRFEPVLGDGGRWGVRLRYSTEPCPEGTAGGLRRAARALETLPAHLVVVNGDLLTGHDLTRQLALALDRPDAEAVLHVRTVPDARPFGCVVADHDGRVSAFLEKSPDPPGREVNAGTYLLSRSVVESIPDGVTSLETDVLPGLVAAGCVLAYREQALWEDVGTPAALVRASRGLVLGSGRDAHIDPTARVDGTALVTGGSAVGPAAVIGAGARVLGSVVMSGAVVGAGADVEDSVVSPGVTVASGRTLRGVQGAPG